MSDINTFIEAEFAGKSQKTKDRTYCIIKSFSDCVKSINKDIDELVYEDFVEILNSLDVVNYNTFHRTKSSILSYLRFFKVNFDTLVDLQSVTHKDVEGYKAYDKLFLNFDEFVSCLKSIYGREVTEGDPYNRYQMEVMLFVLFWVGFTKDEAVRLKSLILILKTLT